MKSTFMIAALILLPLLALANTPKETLTKVETICKKAIAEKGYEGYTYKYVETLRAHSGNYDMSGQLHKGKKRFEFNCFLNKDAKNLKIEDLVINPL